MKTKTKISEKSIEYYRTKIVELEARLAELRRNASRTRGRSESANVQRDGALPQGASIMARVDVGFGNRLYIRGEGGGLSWENGILMQCEHPDLWRWNSGPIDQPIAFKLLVNDQFWAVGANARVAAGEERLIEPAFEYVS